MVGARVEAVGAEAGTGVEVAVGASGAAPRPGRKAHWLFAGMIVGSGAFGRQGGPASRPSGDDAPPSLSYDAFIECQSTKLDRAIGSSHREPGRALIPEGTEEGDKNGDQMLQKEHERGNEAINGCRSLTARGKTQGDHCDHVAHVERRRAVAGQPEHLAVDQPGDRRPNLPAAAEAALEIVTD